MSWHGMAWQTASWSPHQPQESEEASVSKCLSHDTDIRVSMFLDCLAQIKFHTTTLRFGAIHGNVVHVCELRCVAMAVCK